MSRVASTKGERGCDKPEQDPSEEERKARPRCDAVRLPDGRHEASAGLTGQELGNVFPPIAENIAEQHRHDQDQCQIGDERSRGAADEPTNGCTDHADERQIDARPDHDSEYAWVAQREPCAKVADQSFGADERDDRDRGDRQ